MKHFTIIFALLLATSSYADDLNTVDQAISLKGISPQQQLEMNQILEAEVNDLKQELANSKSEIKNGKIYYNIGSIGSIITGWVGFTSLFFVKIKSSGNYREKLVKTHFDKKGKSCYLDLVTELFDARITKYQNKLKNRGRFLKFRRYSQEQINEAMKGYRADLRVDMTLTERELEQKVKEYGRRKRIAWWVFAGSLVSFTGLKVLEVSKYDQNQITEEEKRDLESALERKARELHLMQQTLLQFADENESEPAKPAPAQ